MRRVVTRVSVELMAWRRACAQVVLSGLISVVASSDLSSTSSFPTARDFGRQPEVNDTTKWKNYVKGVYLGPFKIIM